MDPQQGPPQPDALIGQTFGNYLVTQKLGEGGMGSVYLAEHPSIGKKVALKVLHGEFASNADVVDRFFTEAKAVNAIGHPNIVDIIDYGVIQGPQGRVVYFLMEYLSGATLSQVIRAEGALAPERALTIALQVADALAASHRTGIVHRDLKPDNIILAQRGREQDFVKLLDFGIAKLTGEAVGTQRTRTGMVLGTPAYMSPEQCEGRANVDHRTDIYALGICLYEMLVGQVPFPGEAYGDVLIKHLTQRPVEPSRYRMMSPHVEAVVLKALEKRPEMRFPTMDEMMRALADPVGYVEAHGGVTGFLQTQLMPSSAPLPPVRLTPAPMTPAPGVMSPVPGSLTKPTTLGAAAGQVQGTRSKTGFVIAGALVVAAAAGGVFFVLGHKKAGGQVDAGAGPVVSMQTGSGSAGSAGSSAAGSSAAGSAAGSAGSAMAAGSAAGSSAAGSAGSATAGGSAVAMHAGSAGSATAAGSAAGAGNGSATGRHPDLRLATVTITSSPPGAAIIINGLRTGKRTSGGSFTVPRTKARPTIVLHLHGYEDYVMKDVSFDQPDVRREVVLHKKAVASGTHHGKGTSGKGSDTTTPNDTGLMRPEDL